MELIIVIKKPDKKFKEKTFETVDDLRVYLNGYNKHLSKKTRWIDLLKKLWLDQEWTWFTDNSNNIDKIVYGV